MPTIVAAELIMFDSLMRNTNSPYASFGSRLLAKLIDISIIAVCFTALDIVFGTSFVVHRGASASPPGLSAAFFFLIFFLYEGAMECSSRQATLGKLLVGILVTDLDGERLTARRAASRSFAQFVSIYFLCFGHFTSLFSQKKQGIHDLIAHTVVVPGTSVGGPRF